MADLSTIDTNGAMNGQTLAALMHDRVDPSAILNGLVRSVPGVIGAALASPDGRSIAHSDQLEHDSSRAAMAAATMGLAGQLIGVLDARRLEEVVVRCDAGYVLVYAVGNEGVLTALARTSVNLHHIGTEVRSRIDTLITVLQGGQ